jgi:energy-converting hydrogenase Eha subunit C
MLNLEEKIIEWIKITFFFLITMLSVVMFEELCTIVLLMFYIAFMKE